MSEYIEFKGNNLDEAIKKACAYYGTEREKLEIEIINEAKSGIFGLVGAKKATVQARKAELPELDKPLKEKILLPKKEDPKSPPSNRHSETKPVATASSSASSRDHAPHPEAEKSVAAKAISTNNGSLPHGKPASRPAGSHDDRHGKQEENRHKPAFKKDKVKTTRLNANEQPIDKRRNDASDHTASHKGRHNSQPNIDDAQGMVELEAQTPPAYPRLPDIPLDQLDHEKLSAIVLEAVKNISSVIAEPEAEYSVDLSSDRIIVSINGLDNPGLLIGRDGQTLSALQFLVGCIASRRMQASLRVQINAGDYRERQNEKLCSLALALAKKAKEQDKAQSTRPLSSYQRRMVHMALQNDEEISTHSKGDGSLKRIVIVPKRK